MLMTPPVRGLMGLDVQVGALSGPRISHKADISLSNGLTVPRGTMIWPMVYLIHRHSSNWQEGSRHVSPVQ